MGRPGRRGQSPAASLRADTRMLGGPTCAEAPGDGGSRLTENADDTSGWPALPYADWAETCSALHLYTQIVGKYRLARSEEHTSELQSLMRISYAVFCLKKKNTKTHRVIH